MRKPLNVKTLTIIFLSITSIVAFSACSNEKQSNLTWSQLQPPNSTEWVISQSKYNGQTLNFSISEVKSTLKFSEENNALLFSNLPNIHDVKVEKFYFDKKAGVNRVSTLNSPITEIASTDLQLNMLETAVGGILTDEPSISISNDHNTLILRDDENNYLEYEAWYG